ncbi:MAG: hemerythrin domain-containing protein [Eubacteriales bacterium]|nr:hemerythrin domain-containing protein [Eubacteriales bacterium]
MNGIEILIKEHQNILKAVKNMRKDAIAVMNGEEVRIERFREYLAFIRNYADKHHHGKEELILFQYMVDELGGAAEKLVKHGMLVEHDMGRLYAQNLENALNQYEEQANDDSKVDIIANAISYGDLLQRHIDKEDNVVYTFAQRQLKPEIMQKVNEQTIVFEEKEAQTREFYENWVANL